MVNWNMESLVNVETQSYAVSKRGWIPPQAIDLEIQYYLKVADSSGRIEHHPLSGYHQFLALSTDICNEWILGDLDNSQSVTVIDILLLADQVVENIQVGLCYPIIADINGDGFVNVVDIIYLTNQILYQ